MPSAALTGPLRESQHMSSVELRLTLLVPWQSPWRVRNRGNQQSRLSRPIPWREPEPDQTLEGCNTTQRAHAPS